MKINTDRISYGKSPISIEQQITKLKSRRLLFDDEDLARNYLSNISYYRLRAYTFPFQENDNLELDHQFKRDDIQFQDIIDLYCFDRRLRCLLFNAIEKIEVAVRAKMVQIYCDSTHNSHWYEDELLFVGRNNCKSKYEVLSNDIGKEVKRSNEDFIKHYFSRYSSPQMPPAWMALETITFGTLSRIYGLINKDERKIALSKAFGLPTCSILENWLHGISNLRNCCAHHSRIWNRRFVVNVNLCYNAHFPFLNRDMISSVRKNKLFALLCCIKYLSDRISPQSEFKKNLINLIEESGRLILIKDMGFPEHWKSFDIWKD